MALTPFKIHLAPFDNHVEVDGVDVTNKIHGLQITASHNEPAGIMLFGLGEAHIEGLATVEVIRGESVVEFLNTIDPAQLETEALNSGDMGTSPFVAALELLKARASGNG